MSDSEKTDDSCDDDLRVENRIQDIETLSAGNDEAHSVHLQKRTCPPFC